MEQRQRLQEEIKTGKLQLALQEGIVEMMLPERPDTYTESPGGDYLYGERYYPTLRVELIFEMSDRKRYNDKELAQLVDLVKEMIAHSI